jgi:toxin ParE1/3/4
MMRIVLRSSAADKDLADIWDYISQDNLSAAGKLLRQLDSKFRMLAENPQMGQNRDDLAPALRCFSSGNYAIFFRAIFGGVEIVRVLHGVRDIDKFF